MDKECFLCKSKEKDDVKFGEFMTCGKISVHYFCLLLSSNLMQNGQDNEGLLGFLPKDIQDEANRVRPLICCYCQKPNANISCCASKCYKSFHLTCGDKNSTEHNFVGTFKSFCHRHVKGKKVTQPLPDEKCCICYDNIFTPGKKFDTVNMIRAPCCKNGWFHKYCLASFAKTAGYFFKCPLCNDSKVFRQRLAYKSIFIPDRDAAWELVPNAFSELLERPNSCVAVNCYAEGGRKSQSKRNEFLFCLTCGSVAIHRRCMTDRLENFYCDECLSITAAIESSSIVNITSTNVSDQDNEDGENEDIDVGDDFDVSCSVNQNNCEEDSADESINPTGKAKKRCVRSGTESDSESNVKNADSGGNNTSIKAVRIFKSNDYKIAENDLFFNESDDDIASSLLKQNKPIFSEEISDKQSTSTTGKEYNFNVYKTESLLDGEENASSAHKCNSNSSLNSTISEGLHKSELRVLVHVKKLSSFEIEKRVSRRFISLSHDKKEKSNVRPKRSLSQHIEIFSDFDFASKKEKKLTDKTVNMKTEIFEKEDRKYLSMFPAHAFCSNNTSTSNTVISKIGGSILVPTTSKISHIRLRSLSEDTSKRTTSLVERRRSFLQGVCSSTPIQQVTQVNSFKRQTESLESTTSKRSRLDSDTDKESCTLNQTHSNNININYDDENKIDCLETAGFKRRRSRGRSPLSVNLCDVYAYSTLPFVKKVNAPNVDKTLVSENCIDMQQNMPDFFSKNKPNISQSKPKVMENATENNFITFESRTAPDAPGYNTFKIFVATDTLKHYKNKMKRISSQKSTKAISILPGKQTKIESFFKRI